MQLTRALLIAAVGAVLAAPAVAQDEPAEDPAGEAPEAAQEAAPDPEGAAEPGEGEGAAAAGEGQAEGAATPAEPEVVEVVRDEFQDWQVRCAPDESDCFLYQLALDQEDNPVAEVSVLKLPEAAEAAAGVTIVTPLGTLLTEGIVMQVDEGEARQFPFSFCTQVGCFARFGVDTPSVNAMKRGATVRLRLVSVAQPQQPVQLDVSLAGFTAAFDSLEAPELPAAPGAPADPAPLVPEDPAPLAPAE